MPPVLLARHVGMDCHVMEAAAWLEIATRGSATTALSYAAFELRLAIERLLLQYLYASDPEAMSVSALAKSAKRIERRLYQREGRQREIDAKFRFLEIMLELLALLPGW